MKGLLQSIIDEQGCCISDGGLGSELAAAGALDADLWSGGTVLPSFLSPAAAGSDGRSLDLHTRTAHQQTLINIHLQFYASGADICSSSAYQLSYEGLARKGYTVDEADQIFALTTDITREARDRFWTSYQAASSAGNMRRVRPLVAASVGCYGACLPGGVEFTGMYDKGTAELIAWHRRRFRVLANSASDVIGCETVPNIDDVRALVRLANEQPLNKDMWLSMVCRDTTALSSGETLEEATRVLLEEDIDRAVTAIGVNCTAPHLVNTLLETLADMNTGRILMTYPNRGEEWCADSQDWDHSTGMEDEQLARMCKQWYATGARVIGGCCRTTPSTISAIRQALCSQN